MEERVQAAYAFDPAGAVVQVARVAGLEQREAAAERRAPHLLERHEALAGGQLRADPSNPAGAALNGWRRAVHAGRGERDRRRGAAGQAAGDSPTVAERAGD